MSYRGQKGAIEAANRGNYAVMTPGEVLYFDWYQADPSTQPRAMYGYSPIKKMYAFEPVPADPESAARNESIIRAEFVDPAAVEPIRADRADRIVGHDHAIRLTAHRLAQIAADPRAAGPFDRADQPQLVTQLRGEAGPRQVEGAKVGITANQGLFGHGSSVILKR